VRKQQLKWIGYIVLIILILNMILFALGIVNWIVFWGIIIAGAIFVYKVLPRMKE